MNENSVFYPRILQVELTDVCNAKCSYCDRSRVKNGMMPLELFTKIIEETPSAMEIHPQFWGESTLHKDFVEACEFAATLGKKVNYYTNASRLHMLDLDRLLRATNRLMISLESTNHEHLSSVRARLNYEQVSDNIRATWFLRETLQLPVRIIIRATNVFQNISELEHFKNTWHPYCDDLIVRERTQTGQEIFIPIPCSLVNEHCVIKWDGTMVMCVVDHFADYPVGNVKNSSVLEVFNSSKFQELRDGAGLEHNICKSCWFLSDKRKLSKTTDKLTSLISGAQGIRTV